MWDAPLALESIAGGWSLNGIATMRTGEPMNVSARNQQLNTGTNNWSDVTCSGIGMPKRVEQWFDTACFADPATFTFGNAKTGVLRGPGVVNFDISVFKSFRFLETRSVEFRAEFFNALNNPHFSNPGNNPANLNFGRITGTSLPPREIQLGLKLKF